jgi:AcrR family transcriptional regulator
VAAAIRSSREHGSASVSMRRLADELGVTAMALYAHVADKDEIMDEVLDDALGQLELPSTPTADWRAWLIEVTEQLHRLLVSHPPLLERYCRRPVGVPSALRRMEQAFAVLAEAGFDDTVAAEVVASVHTFTLGFTTLSIARQTDAERRSRAVGTEPDPGSPAYWPMFFATLPADSFPNLRRVQPDLAAFTSDAEFRRGLEVILGAYSPKPRRAPRRRATAR